jgi:hypothetical protein
MGAEKEISTIKLSCYCHSATEKVKYNDKVNNSVLYCSNNGCGNTFEGDMYGAANIYMLLTKMIQNKMQPEPFCHLGRIL